MRVDLVSLRSAGSAGATPQLLSEWRIGAILQAVAVRDALTSELWLDIGGRRYPARVASGDTAGPANGEKLQVRVLRNSPVLALEALPSDEPAAADPDTGVIADAMRRYVPRQESPAALMANVAWVAQAKPGVAALPQPIVEAAVKLWQALPRPETLADPKTLQNALQRSGAFLEASLTDTTRAPAAASTDVKALMLSLRETLREYDVRPATTRFGAETNAPIPTARGALDPLPPMPATIVLADSASEQMGDLARQTDGALARLTTLQTTNSAAQEPSAQSILIELPVRHDERATILRLRIERDGSRGAEGGAGESWSVEAAVDLGAGGALHARVTLNGHRVGVQLRAASPAVVEALTARAPELEAMLRDSGLIVDRVVCLHGMPAGDTGAKPTRLLDVRV
jgi:hypothetical protein